mmetsp:Transcript_14726/g.36474  ORF Transcript_14726/g.36474 Transcript_14726/m.36474 type:complete len:88 (-) Transcript_14726:119-382(-)
MQRNAGALSGAGGSGARGSARGVSGDDGDDDRVSVTPVESGTASDDGHDGGGAAQPRQHQSQSHGGRCYSRPSLLQSMVPACAAASP